MEQRALETLKTILKSRSPTADVTADAVTIDNLTQGASTPANAYTLGDTLVVFTQRAKLLEHELRATMKTVGNSEYKGRPLILVALSPPSENVLKLIKSYAKDGLQFFWIQQLQFDLTQHRMYMPHRIMKDDEKTEMFNQFNVTDAENQLPWIDSQDPPVKWIGAKPGDVIEVTRHSDAAGPSKYYRYVVEDVNIAQ